MLGFKLLGYSNYMSIGLGAIAGIAAGLISAWWTPTEEREKPKKEVKIALLSRLKTLTQKTQTEAEPTEAKQAESETSTPSDRFPEYGIMGIRRRKRQRRAIRRFAWLFRKK